MAKKSLPPALAAFIAKKAGKTGTTKAAPFAKAKAPAKKK